MWRRKLAEILLPVGTAMAAYAAAAIWPDLTKNVIASWLILAVAAAFILYGILNQLRDQSRQYKSLQDTADWIGMRSDWTKKYAAHGDSWVTYLRRDLLDALGTGQVRARGRRPFSNGTSLYGAEPIPSDFWPQATFHLLNNINDKSDALIFSGNRYEKAFTEIELDFGDVKQVFGRNWFRVLTWKNTPLFRQRADEEELRAKIEAAQSAT